MSDESVRDKALLLAAAGRRVSLSQQKASAAIAVTSRIKTLRDNLEALRTVLQAARRLNERGAQISLQDIDKGLDNFRKRAGAGVPSKRTIDNAASIVGDLATRIQKDLQGEWQSWCKHRMAELKTDRIAMLPSGEAMAAEASLADLEKLRRGEPRAAAIQQFAFAHRELRTQLDAAPEPDPEVLKLLDRLRVGTTLDTLTLADIQLLFDRKLAGTIEVRRRAV